MGPEANEDLFPGHDNVSVPLSLYTVNKQKYSKAERKFMMNQASALFKLGRKKVPLTRLLSLYMSNNYCFYTFEQPTESTLMDFMMHTDKPLNLAVIKTIAKSLLQAVQYIHGKDIVHLDIQPQSILVNNAAKLDWVEDSVAP